MWMQNHCAFHKYFLIYSQQIEEDSLRRGNRTYVHRSTSYSTADCQKQHTFVKYLSTVFRPSPIIPFNDTLQELNQVLAETIVSNATNKIFPKYEIKSVITSLIPKKF